ncbi:MAG: 1-deoxy-D-xylulose-5-phosphate reductoisomerase [Nitriliruptorales bacterium]|nr:1-deoxy-D-xylulose-5-phosphate reductoisomerase [Nitriliruptorales bacterium]
MDDRPTSVIILGSTGSIGRQALDVIAEHPQRFDVVGLSAGANAELLCRQAQAFEVERVAVADADAARSVREAFSGRVAVLDGESAAATLASAGADVVLNGIVGSRGLRPTLAALDAGSRLALANKESLIVGGELVKAAAGDPGRIVPVDSEHSALAQCLRAGRPHEVARLILTASGGPFRGRTRDELGAVTVADALDHPTWSMGAVITVNSATLANKGLEVIEAHLLFDVPYDRIQVVVHPQSIVHGMVEFVDGATVAELSPPDMRLPIQVALGWPDRLPTPPSRMDWDRPVALEFEPLDRETFPMVDLATAAGRRGGTTPGVFNAANEEAVAAFLQGRVRFPGIGDVVAAVLEEHTAVEDPDLDAVLGAETWARGRAHHLIRALEDRTATCT